MAINNQTLIDKLAQSLARQVLLNSPLKQESDTAPGVDVDNLARYITNCALSWIDHHVRYRT